MKVFLILSVVAGFFISCSRNSTTVTTDNTAEATRDQLITIAEDYILSHCRESQKTVAGNGAITIIDGQKRYLIEPVKIFTGPIDDDPGKDAIVSVATFDGQYQTTTEHLIILNSSGKYGLAKVIRSDMEILFIKGRVITADVPTHSRSSPLFNCSECRDVLNYQFKGGELIQME